MLTELAIKNLVPRDKPYKVSDGDESGLYVRVQPHNSKLFQMKYRNAERAELADPAELKVKRRPVDTEAVDPQLDEVVQRLMRRVEV